MSSSRAQPIQAQPIGPVGGAFCYAVAVALLGAGPLCALLDKSWFAGVIPGIFTFPIGVALVAHTVMWRSQARQLAGGAEAIAEILSVDRIRPTGEGDETAELTIRLSGPGFEPYDAPCELPVRSRPFAVGDRFDAVVDPDDHTFAILG
ncbi:hypothetical protein [Nocardia sp. NPDC050406]|uniref:hypothetical protein n=1 Tax=Nocardia sp. NPDC050406 TaxID=3364318 RepID=UPI00378C273E